jgi:hypothetical protein
MKKMLCAAVAMVMTGLSVYANNGMVRDKAGKETKKELRKEKREERKAIWYHSVNSLTETQFYSDFPDAKDVGWTEGRYAEATFHDGDILKTAYYDSDNNLIATTTDVDFSVLPAKAKEYIAKKYPGYDVKEVVLLDDNEDNDTDMYMFNTMYGDKDSYFPVMASGSKEIILNVTLEGDVSFVQDYK